MRAGGGLPKRPMISPPQPPYWYSGRINGCLLSRPQRHSAEPRVVIVEVELDMGVLALGEPGDTDQPSERRAGQ
jgi:hypothetical protein